MSRIDEYDWTQLWEDSAAPISDDYRVVREWSNEDRELNVVAVICTDTNLYYAVSGWHDYTGWDCQSGVTWFGPFDSAERAAVQLSQEDRRSLGFETAPDHKGLYRD